MVTNMQHEKTYIGEVVSRAVKTVFVHATSRKEALEKIRRGDCEGIDVIYELKGYRVLYRENYIKRPNSTQQDAQCNQGLH